MNAIVVIGIIIGSTALAVLCAAVWCAAMLCTSKLAKCVHGVERESSDLRRVHANLLSLVKSEKEERAKLEKERVILEKERVLARSFNAALWSDSREAIHKAASEFDQVVFKHDAIKELVKRKYPGPEYVNRAQVLEFLANELARRMAEDSVSPVMQSLAPNTALSGVVEDMVMARPCSADFVGISFSGKIERICHCVNSIPEARDGSAGEEAAYAKMVELGGMTLGAAYSIRKRGY